MRKRTFEEMITYFNQTVSEMDIDRKYKMTLLGLFTTLLQKHDEDVAEIVRCNDCKYWHREIYNGIEYLNFSSCDLNHHGDGHNFYCSDAERRTDA